MTSSEETKIYNISANNFTIEESKLYKIRKMSEKGEAKTYNISANNFTIEESKLNHYNILYISNCIFKTEDI